MIVVDVGNPHAVVIGDPDDLARIGPLLETHERFPNRTNVQVARVDGPGEVTARVWERGVGETQSSGTSAVAVAAATHGEGDASSTSRAATSACACTQAARRSAGPPCSYASRDRCSSTYTGAGAAFPSCCRIDAASAASGKE